MDPSCLSPKHWEAALWCCEAVKRLMRKGLTQQPYETVENPPPRFIGKPSAEKRPRFLALQVLAEASPVQCRKLEDIEPYLGLCKSRTLFPLERSEPSTLNPKPYKPYRP